MEVNEEVLYWVEQFLQNILEIFLYGIEDKSILFYPLFRNSSLKIIYQLSINMENDHF